MLLLKLKNLKFLRILFLLQKKGETTKEYIVRVDKKLHPERYKTTKKPEAPKTEVKKPEAPKTEIKKPEIPKSEVKSSEKLHTQVKEHLQSTGSADKGAKIVEGVTKPSLTSRVSFNNYWTLGDFGDSDPGVLTISVSAPSIAISAPGVTTTAKGDISGDVPSYTPPSITNAADGSMGNDTDMDISEMSTATWTSLDYDFDNENMDFLKWFQVAGDFIQNEEDTELAAAQIQKINTYISAYQTAMQNKLNTFNKENVRYQANIQAEMQKQQHLASENTLEAQQTLEAAIQDASLEIQKYQAAVNDEVQEYSQKLARYQLELNTVFQAWQKTESDSLSQYQADMQNELNEFNKESAEYQAQLQVSIQNAQIDNEEDARKLTKYQSELQQYASEVQSEVSEFSTKLQKQQSYSKESEKYYTWAKLEIKNYIENNSKTMAATMAAAGAR